MKQLLEMGKPSKREKYYKTMIMMATKKKRTKDENSNEWCFEHHTHIGWIWFGHTVEFIMADRRRKKKWKRKTENPEQWTKSNKGKMISFITDAVVGFVFGLKSFWKLSVCALINIFWYGKCLSVQPNIIKLKDNEQQ